MNSRKLISKVSMLSLVGATILGSSSSLYAKTYTKVFSYKVSVGSRPGAGCTNTGSGSTGSGSTGSGSTGSGSAGSGNATTEDSSTAVSTQTQFENKVLELVNAERAKNGLSALKMDESVRSVARVKSADMSKNNYFSHTSPTYGTPFNMLKTYGISYSSAAENIAKGYTTPEAVVQGWMNSSGHRANILSSKYTKIGIGYEANGNYWTQMFIG